MRSSSDRWGRGRSLMMRAGLVLAALIGYVVASGCGQIQVTEATPPSPPVSNVSNAPAVGERHDVGIMAVDFDPALSVERIAANQPINLLVGVENLGNRGESTIQVHATLYSGDRRQVLMTDNQQITDLTAGNLTVLHFTRNQAPPRYDSYVLTVDIDPVAREVNTVNNHRTLNIQITGLH
jgi:hypothetical protein